MGEAEQIYKISKQLPVQVQQELLDFAEYLRIKKGAKGPSTDMIGTLQNNALRRTPHPDIAGKIRILGDIMNGLTESDWNLPK